MKLITSLFVFFAVFSSIYAQTGVRFGVKSGYSVATQYGLPSTDETLKVNTEVRHGLSGGVFVYFPITESVGVQNEWIYTMKGSRHNVTITDPVPVNTFSKYNLAYLEMPLLIRYTFVKLGDVGIYGNSGLGLSLLLAGNYDIVGTVNIGGEPITITDGGDMKTVDTFDYSFIYGVGADFKLFDMDFFLECRMTIGWNTLELPNLQGVATIPLRNQNYIFSLGMFF